MAWYWWLVVIGLILVAVGIAVRELFKITAWGGDRTDALQEADRFHAEAEAFRGSSSPNNAKLDGKQRIARPKDELGPFFGP